MKGIRPYAIGGAVCGAARKVNAGSLGFDARQTRAHPGGRQQPVDCLGHRQGLPRPWRRLGFDLPGRRVEETGRAARTGTFRARGRPLRRHRSGDRGCGVCRGRGAMGRARFPGARHRLLGQGPALRPLCRHHGRKFRQDVADLVLFIHRARPARRKADAERRVARNAHLLRRREVDAPLQRHGRRQGRARGVGALSRRRSRREGDSRERDLVGPDQDAGRIGHRRLPLHPQMERAQCAAAADRHDRGGRRHRGLFSVRLVAWCDW